MKKFLKLMLGIGGCLFYYIVVCILLDIDVFDPWEKVMKWAKGEKKEEDMDDSFFDEKENGMDVDLL